MLSKEYLKKIFNNASLDNNNSAKDNIVAKWVHRFGFDSLNDLLLQGSDSNIDEEEKPEQIDLTNENYEEEPEQIDLMNENYEEEEQEQIDLMNEKYEKENISEIIENEISKENSEYNRDYEYDKKTSEYENYKSLPLPNINNLRRWINNEKKAS